MCIRDRINQVGLQHGFIGGNTDLECVGASQAATTATATAARQEPEQQQSEQSEYPASHRKHGAFSPHKVNSLIRQSRLTLGNRAILQDLRRHENQQLALGVRLVGVSNQIAQ